MILTPQKTIDRSSRAVGLVVGQLINRHLEKQIGQKIHRIKGTIFSAGNRIIIRRICGSSDYLHSSMVHFSNLSTDQHTQIKQEGKKFLYLFVTVEEKTIEYWLIPARAMDSIIPQLDLKADGVNCFVRITEEEGSYFLGEKDITRYHEQIKKPSSFAASVAKTKRRRLGNKLLFTR